MDQQGEPARDRGGLTARRSAQRLLAGVVDGRTLGDQAGAVLDALGPQDRARALRLATETLRWASRSDRVLGPYLRRRPSPVTHMTLRLAVWELLGLGLAPHGVVDTAVTLVREASGQSESRMANAVLRRIAEEPPDWNALPIPELPKWLRKRLVATYGKQGVASIEAAHARGAPLDLTPHPDAPAELADILGAEVLPTGSWRLAEPGQITRLPGYEDGHWWVQDAAAAMPARLLEPKPGMRVIDLCAAPGGKTLQLAAAGAVVTAVDLSAQRLARVSENLRRARLRAEVVAADAQVWRPDILADAVLLDAPCSATGTIRRHPDLPFVRDGSGIGELTAAQARLIDAALEMVAPGGVLVYATCALLPEEGEGQVAAALSRHPGLRVDLPAIAGVEPGWIVPEGLRLRPDFWPERGGMDGFFATRLRKPAEGEESRRDGHDRPEMLQ